MKTFHVEPKDVQNIIRATFPNYAGKKVSVQGAEEVMITDLNWTGGSRTRYAACTLDGQPTGNADAGNAAPPFRNPVEGKTVPIPQGFALVAHVMFCGKDLGLRIHVNPADMPKYLPVSTGDLSAQEKEVLSIIGSLISSYRREEAARKGISAQQYDSIVESLKTKGLLAKNGALTLAGKNAR
jgi:hypothetical protein